MDKAEVRLEEALKVTQEVEMKRTEAETEIQSAERDTRMLSRRRDDLETEVRELDKQRAIVQKTLESLQVLHTAPTSDHISLSRRSYPGFMRRLRRSHVSDPILTLLKKTIKLGSWSYQPSSKVYRPKVLSC